MKVFCTTRYRGRNRCKEQCKEYSIRGISEKNPERILRSEICIHIIRVRRGGPFIKRTGWHSEAIIDTSSSSFSWSVSVNTWTQGFVISGHQIFNACTTPAYEPLCSSKRRTVPWNRNSERYTANTFLERINTFRSIPRDPFRRVK